MKFFFSEPILAYFIIIAFRFRKPDYETPINNGFLILIWQNNLSTGVPVVETRHAPSLQVTVRKVVKE